MIRGAVTSSPVKSMQQTRGSVGKVRLDKEGRFVGFVGPIDEGGWTDRGAWAFNPRLLPQGWR